MSTTSPIVWAQMSDTRIYQYWEFLFLVPACRHFSLTFELCDKAEMKSVSAEFSAAGTAVGSRDEKQIKSDKVIPIW